MTRSQAWYLTLACSVCVCCFLTACPSGGTSGSGGSDGTQPPAAAKGTLAGQVCTLAGTPIAGTAVTLDNGRSASTDDNGFYSFTDLDAGTRIVANFKATGFAPTSRAFTISDDQAKSPTHVLMAPAAPTVTIDADTSSTQRSGDSAVTLSAGSLVDADGTAVTGSVDLTATFLDPSTEGVMAFPGSFADAETLSGSGTTLESFGFAIYELSQNGSPVNLAPGSTADIEYVLPDNAQARFTIGDTIPMWEFDEQTAMWMESGAGDIRLASDGSGRLAWFATIDHFSSWNCDAPIEDKHSITGRVLFEGNSVSGADISAVGVTYNGTSTTRSTGDGTFCVEVKRGATVRIEVRLNGAAIPLLARTITVPDTPADCASGGSMEIGNLDAVLESCVSGLVLNDDGSPATGVTVFVVPGESTTTDSTGFYCAATVTNREVYVFVQGRPSVAVMTPPSATCGTPSCANADLTLTLPEDGDDVGTLTASSTTFISGLGDLGGGGTFFSLGGAFFIADAEALSEIGLTGALFPGFQATTQEIDGCTVTTQTFTISSDTTSDPSSFFDFGGLGALDPGQPGVASNGTASVNLFPGDPSVTDPPTAFFAGLYSPNEGPDELLNLGFGPSQDISFSFPGGTDIGPFNTSVAVPADIVVLSPDLADPNLSLNLSEALDLLWVAGNPADIVVFTIVVSSFDSSVDPDGNVTSTGSTVFVTCDFPDNGSGNVPASAMASLPTSGGLSSSTSLTFSRARTVQASVPLMRVGGNGTVRVTGSTNVSRIIVTIPDIPDLCSFVTCPAGEVCDPTTFLCEPG